MLDFSGFADLKRVARAMRVCANGRWAAWLLASIGCDCRARRAETRLVRLHVTLPQLSLFNVGDAEFPVLVRTIDALDEALPLLILRMVEEDVDDPCAIAVEMVLELNDRPITLLPNGLPAPQLVRKSLTSKKLRMHAHNEAFFVVLAFMSAGGADPKAATGSGAARLARYARVKGEAEEAVKPSGPAVVRIFRPGMIIGAQHTRCLLETLLPAFSFVTPAKYKSITVKHIAKAMIATSRNTPANSDVYHNPEMVALHR